MQAIHVNSRGAGADVVLVHGLPQDPQDLDRLALDLSAEFRTHLVHLPGYGRSPVAPSASIEGTRDLVAAALERAGVRTAAYVGMSGGFYRVLHLLLTRGTPAAWALVGLGAVAGIAEEDRALFRGAAEAFSAGADLTGLLVARMLSPGFAAAHPEDAVRAGRAALAAPAATIAAELLAFADAADLRPRLGEVRCPVYLRTGELDLPTPPAHARSIVAGLADARLDIVPGAGHLVQVEDYPGVLASVRAALVAAARRG